jgi:phage tail-like protein
MPMAASRFAITVDGYEIASFSELQGITTKVDPVEFMKAEGRYVIPKLPGEPQALTLKHGASATMDMWVWHEAARNGLMSGRKNVAMLVYTGAGDPVARYHLEQAWPSKLKLGGRNAEAAEIVVEHVTLTYDRMKRY